MHRKEQLEKLINEWIELDLPETCSKLDNYNSVKIVRTVSRIYFTHKLRGNNSVICVATVNAENKLDGLIMTDSTPIMALVLFGLEKAIETN